MNELDEYKINANNWDMFTYFLVLIKVDYWIYVSSFLLNIIHVSTRINPMLLVVKQALRVEQQEALKMVDTSCMASTK